MNLLPLLSKNQIKASSFVLAFFASLALAIIPVRAVAKSGDLDPTFNNSVVSEIPMPGGDFGTAHLVQNDGKHVIAGYRYGQYRSMALVRLNPDGSRDNTFGVNGVSTETPDSTPFTIDGFYQPIGIQQKSNGKLILAAEYTNWTIPSITFMQYNADGSLDSSFGVDGAITHEFSYDSIGFSAFASDSSGRLIIAGTVGDTFYETRDFILSRFNSDGTLDTLFGTDGVVRTDFGTATDTSSANDTLYSVVIQSDDKILAAGTNGKEFPVVVRYLPNGTPDASFSADGVYLGTNGFAFTSRT